MKFMLGIAPLLGKYLLLFQTEELSVHRLYPERQDLIFLMKWLLKPEILEGQSTSEIVKVNVSNQDPQFPLKKLILVKLRIIFYS